ncbi:hypothetical protein VTN00DRAFT_315 [Thermoascus crustaceus]|uniref:uncharacterized protein n=1 Tax=Thermoascus crustaceus TaxID=5088 RepID=UPI0037424985
MQGALTHFTCTQYSRDLFISKAYSIIRSEPSYIDRLFLHPSGIFLLPCNMKSAHPKPHGLTIPEKQYEEKVEKVEAHNKTPTHPRQERPKGNQYVYRSCVRHNEEWRNLLNRERYMTNTRGEKRLFIF